MHTLGLPFETRQAAEAALQTAMRMQTDGLLNVHESALIAWDLQGRAQVPAPFIGAAGQLKELARPGHTVLALLVSEVAGMAVIEELRRFHSTAVVYTKVLNHPERLASMTR
ncbi:MAG: hypothetical protein M4D80_17930 [Myxococcota bacterium]|nr:hypothetical protein [Myxococcota bacterium]